ncbi:MAG: hypothetical protein DWI57_10360 [Chloroflexi bacterium]|nr:MAG: hypothetical protein DWI57_10360 [Chloroflexota bacterium]
MNNPKFLDKTDISQATSPEAIGEFWDTHSLDDYWEKTHAVEITVRALPRHRIVVEPTIYSQLEDRARRRGLLPETLVNLWLAERLAGDSGA